MYTQWNEKISTAEKNCLANKRIMLQLIGKQYQDQRIEMRNSSVYSTSETKDKNKKVYSKQLVSA